MTTKVSSMVALISQKVPKVQKWQINLGLKQTKSNTTRSIIICLEQIKLKTSLSMKIRKMQTISFLSISLMMASMLCLVQGQVLSIITCWQWRNLVRKRSGTACWCLSLLSAGGLARLMLSRLLGRRFICIRITKRLEVESSWLMLVLVLEKVILIKPSRS